LNENAITPTSIILTKEGSADPIPGENKVDSNNKKILKFIPKMPLEGATKYSIKISKAIKDTNESLLESDIEWIFETNP
jgi:hypothetical protein